MLLLLIFSYSISQSFSSNTVSPVYTVVFSYKLVCANYLRVL